MAITLQYREFDSPLRFNFKHASADRKSAQSIIVRLTDGDGITGYGEGCPRLYVTGETNETAKAFVDTYAPDMTQEITTLASLKEWIKTHQSLIDKNPAAFCAIEIALLDLMARRQGLSIENFLGIPEFSEPIQYTAVIGDSSPLTMRLIVTAYRLYGFDSYKVKLSGDLARDRKRLKPLPKTKTIRFDANNGWNNADDCINHINNLNLKAWAIEEPVTAFNYVDMQDISASLKIPVILDESLYTQKHLDTVIQSSGNYIANIRVSKCGGIIRSMELANKCAEQNINVILGAHVGETSLLTRAAIAVGQGLNRQPIAREGAYGKLLLKHDVCTKSLCFGYSGTLNLSNINHLSNLGLGIEYYFPL